LASLESERAMNAQLTAELEALTPPADKPTHGERHIKFLGPGYKMVDGTVCYTANGIKMKYKPFQHVQITALEHKGRIVRCILDGGPQPLYLVHYIINGEGKSLEFYEDEIVDIL
jgi:hypothetical protein